MLTDAQRLNIYRIVQESLFNVQKHACAEEVSVIVRRELKGESSGLYISIADDGKGFNAQSLTYGGLARGKHLGLKGMRQRSSLLAGTVNITSS